jgi:potassium efflux system protein
LIKSIAILVLTLVAARNIPGLLELTLFRRLNLQTGTAFAYTTSIRYFILLIGIMLSFGTVGISWSKVQWIAAAITLGVGFGLQEVFANFVAGLILLFERPIRFGDYVTIGDLSGQVTQIRMRATTIRDFSNRELVVPNKEFITKELLNWTLTDSVIRLEIPVGIAYGSDTEKARQVLEQVAEREPAILSAPPAKGVFLGFGSSSLDFELRGYIRGVEDHINVRSRLHFAIDAAFREAGIEIAFPQSDLHIRSLPEGGLLVKNSPGEDSSD